MWKSELPLEQVFPCHENAFKMKASLSTDAFELEPTSFKEFTENLCSSAEDITKNHGQYLFYLKVKI